MTKEHFEFIAKALFYMAVGFLAVIVLSACTTATVVVKWKCPPLSPAPLSAVDALVEDSRKNASTGAWVVDLDRHYQKCDIINSNGKAPP